MTTDSYQIPASCSAWLAAHPEWAPVPGARYYEASHRGFVRSIDRVIGGRQLRSVVLKPLPHQDGYTMVNLTGDEGGRAKKTIHSIVLLAHAGACPSGMETLHGPGGPDDNRYCGCGSPDCTEGNIRYDTKKQNDAERIAALRQAGRSGNGRAMPEPKAVRLCILCSAPVTSGGRRCHKCVVRIGRDAAKLSRAGVSPERAAELLDYPSPSGLATLAARYGRRPWYQRAATTFRSLFWSRF